MVLQSALAMLQPGWWWFAGIPFRKTAGALLARFREDERR